MGMYELNQLVLEAELLPVDAVAVTRAITAAATREQFAVALEQARAECLQQGKDPSPQEAARCILRTVAEKVGARWPLAD